MQLHEDIFSATVSTGEIPHAAHQETGQVERALLEMGDRGRLAQVSSCSPFFVLL